MFRKIFLFFLLVFCWSLGALATETAESTDTTSMYRYVLDNYFSKRGASKTTYYGSFSRYFFLSSSVDFYRVKADKNFSAFSAFDLSYTQNVREISRFGDLQFRVSALSSLLEKRPSFFPRIDTSSYGARGSYSFSGLSVFGLRGGDLSSIFDRIPTGFFVSWGLFGGLAVF